MDPLSLTAGIAGLIKVSVMLSQTVVSITKDVKNYPKEFNALVESTNQMYDLIWKIGPTIKEHKGEASGSAPLQSQLMGIDIVTESHIRGCQNTMQNIVALLTKCIVRKGDKVGNAIKSIAWTIKNKAELKVLMDELQQHKMMFNLALTGDLRERVIAEAQTASAAREAVEKDRESAQTERRVRKRREVLDWLSVLDYKSRHTDIQSKRAKNSGLWILRDKRFENWVHSEISSALYCIGPAGVGKSYLTSGVIGHLQDHVKDHNMAIAYFYFDYQNQDSKSHSATAIIGTLLRQIATYSDVLDSDLEKAFDDHFCNNDPITLATLTKLLRSASRAFSSCYILLDALDESGNAQKDILETLNDLCTGSDSRFKGFATSRHHPKQIQSVFDPVSTIEIAADDADIRNFLEQKLMAEEFPVPPDLQATIIKKLLENAQGSFLLVTLQLQHVLKQTFPPQRKKALKSLPKSPDEAYTRIMERIEKKETGYKDIVLPALSLLFYAKRSILMSELPEALAVHATIDAAVEEHDDQESNADNSDDSRDSDESGSDNDSDSSDSDDEQDCRDLPSYLPPSAYIIELCEGLLMHERSSEIVKFSHYSIVHFLKARQGTLLSKVTLGKTCVKYLLFDRFEEGACRDVGTFRTRQEKYKFMAYAAQYWGAYTKGDGESDVVLGEMVLRLLGSEKKRDSMLEMADNGGRKLYFPLGTGHTSLHIVSQYGLSSLCRSLVDSKGLGSSSDVSLKSLGVFERLPEICRLLVGEMANTSARDGMGATALHCAVQQGHKDMVRVLLDVGHANVSEQDIFGWAALHFASQRGDKEIVATLLDRYADVTVRDDAERTALHYAAEYGHKDVVQTLTERILLSETETGNISQVEKTLIASLNTKSDAKIDLLSKLVRIFPSDYIYHRLLAGELWKEGEHKKAIKSYESSLRLNPVNSSVTRVEDVHHGGTICNHCKQKLIGIRCRCTTCYDFDLCRECFPKADRRCDSNHGFMEFPSAADWKPIEEADSRARNSGFV